jgi:hypothetical protein
MRQVTFGQCALCWRSLATPTGEADEKTPSLKLFSLGLVVLCLNCLRDSKLRVATAKNKEGQWQSDFYLDDSWGAVLVYKGSDSHGESESEWTAGTKTLERYISLEIQTGLNDNLGE